MLARPGHRAGHGGEIHPGKLFLAVRHLKPTPFRFQVHGFARFDQKNIVITPIERKIGQDTATSLSTPQPSGDGWRGYSIQQAARRRCDLDKHEISALLAAD